MTYPVCDPNTPNTKFDRSQIEFYLAQKAENPFTRTPLTPEQLVADEALKNQIDDYIFKLENPPVPVLYSHNSRIRQSELTLLKSEAEAFVGTEPLQSRRRNP